MEVLIYSYLRIVSALNNCDPDAINNTCQTTLPEVSASSGSLTIVIQIVFGIIGALSVLFIVIGGLKFISSQDDPQAVARARQTIVFALIGLVIALAAEFIVTFVLGRI